MAKMKTVEADNDHKVYMHSEQYTWQTSMSPNIWQAFLHDVVEVSVTFRNDFSNTPVDVSIQRPLSVSS